MDPCSTPSKGLRMKHKERGLHHHVEKSQCRTSSSFLSFRLLRKRSAVGVLLVLVIVYWNTYLTTKENKYNKQDEKVDGVSGHGRETAQLLENETATEYMSPSSTRDTPKQTRPDKRGGGPIVFVGMPESGEDVVDGYLSCARDVSAVEVDNVLDCRSLWGSAGIETDSAPQRQGQTLRDGVVYIPLQRFLYPIYNEPEWQEWRAIHGGGEHGMSCCFPQVRSSFETWATATFPPHSTIVLNTVSNLTKWIIHVRSSGDLVRQLLLVCPQANERDMIQGHDYDGFRNVPEGTTSKNENDPPWWSLVLDDQKLVDLYHSHIQRVKTWFQSWNEQGQARLLELVVDSPTALSDMEQALGDNLFNNSALSASGCWNRPTNRWEHAPPQPREERQQLSTPPFANREGDTEIATQKEQDEEKQDEEEKRHNQREPLYGLPIWIVGLPKMGTSTLASYFYCGGLKTAHFFCAPRNSTLATQSPREMCGVAMWRNQMQGRPILEGMDHVFDVYSDMGVQHSQPERKYSGSGVCHFPQSGSHLELFLEQYPHASIVLNTRNLTKWIQSVARWGVLQHKLLWGCPQLFPNFNATTRAETTEQDYQDALESFYRNHIHHIRALFQNETTRRNHVFVEVDIESPRAGQVLQEAFGISEDCWGHANQNDGSKALSQSNETTITTTTTKAQEGSKS